MPLYETIEQNGSRVFLWDSGHAQEAANVTALREAGLEEACRAAWYDAALRRLLALRLEPTGITPLAQTVYAGPHRVSEVHEHRQYRRIENHAWRYDPFKDSDRGGSFLPMVFMPEHKWGPFTWHWGESIIVADVSALDTVCSLAEVRLIQAMRRSKMFTHACIVARASFFPGSGSISRNFSRILAGVLEDPRSGNMAAVFPVHFTSKTGMVKNDEIASVGTSFETGE